MTNNTATLLAISTAARMGNGDQRATERTTGRFCTEALVDAAISAVSGMTVAQRDRYVSSHPTYGTITRERAVATLCGWTSCQNVIEFGATLAAARRDFDGALELLGAAL